MNERKVLWASFAAAAISCKYSTDLAAAVADEMVRMMDTRFPEEDASTPDNRTIALASGRF